MIDRRKGSGWDEIQASFARTNELMWIRTPRSDWSSDVDCYASQDALIEAIEDRLAWG